MFDAVDNVDNMRGWTKHPGHVVRTAAGSAIPDGVRVHTGFCAGVAAAWPELRVVRRYCEEHGPGTSAGQRGPRGWVAEAWALGAAPGFFWRRCSLLGAALAEPWWALFPTQVRSRCPSLVSLSGVVLVETRHTLVLQGEDGAKRRVPKAGSTFMLTLPAVDGGHPLTVHLRGEQLTRAAKG